MTRGKHPFANLAMVLTIVGAIGGAAVAFPARFHEVVFRAEQAVGLHRDVNPGADTTDGASHPGHTPGAGGAGGNHAHAAADCQAVVASVMADPPSDGDVHGLRHAIAVVEANCEKSPKAGGLLNALQHLLANAAKHEGHTSHAGGNGNGHAGGNGNGHAGGNGNGHAGAGD